jgi:hypothetical protein
MDRLIEQITPSPTVFDVALTGELSLHQSHSREPPAIVSSRRHFYRELVAVATRHSIVIASERLPVKLLITYQPRGT